MRHSPLVLALAIPLLAPVAARGDDPAAARAQLEVGYALKEQGNYAEALPHLLESLHLGVELKTLTNLADCEEHLDRLVDAQKHWVLARDRAGLEGNDKLREGAASRLAALEKRMPRLTLKLASGSPPDASVARDGTTLGSISLGLPLPTDPGEHVVVVRAKGHADATTRVTLAEAEQKEVAVGVGPDVALTVAVAPASPPGELEAPHASLGTRKTLAVVAASTGGAAILLGAVFGGVAINAWGNAEADCGHGCSATSSPQTEREHATTDAAVSTVAFVAGAALLVSGAALWLTAPGSKETPLAPKAVVLVPGLGSLSLQGAF